MTLPVPDSKLWPLFVLAAKRHNVPATLLLAVAAVESGLDASKVDGSRVDADGVIFYRSGLFQMSQLQFETAAALEPVSPTEVHALDAGEAVELAAKYFGELRRIATDAADDGDGWQPAFFVASFFFARYGLLDTQPNELRAGMERAAGLTSGTNPDQWPDPPKAYVKAVLDAWRTYQDQGKPQGKDKLEQLRNAVENLQTLQTTWQPVLAQLGRDLAEYAANRALGVGPLGVLDFDKNQTDLHMLWQKYAAIFDRCPYTDATTPAPFRLEPNVPDKLSDPAMELLGKAYDAAKAEVSELLDAAGEKLKPIGEAAVEIIGYAIAGAAVIGVAWVFANRRSGRR